AELDIAERDLSIVRPGQQVTLRFASGHPIEVSGPITFIAPELDPKTRTAKARVPVDNPDGALRAQMFGEARIVVPRPRGEVLVPRDAIQRARSVDVVFVRLADDTYEARRVRRSAREGTLVAVTGNVRAGEDIVTQGSFLLKTETIADSIGAGCADDH
ncbi:efflux RND transporter periplasmic adaptor subunit, partial [Myxococcota bacterium]|nr:efflux RND transporter periplasmic adaptor subunit [Myxococcota bacterium]